MKKVILVLSVMLSFTLLTNCGGKCKENCEKECCSKEHKDKCGEDCKKEYCKDKKENPTAVILLHVENRFC